MAIIQRKTDLWQSTSLSPEWQVATPRGQWWKCKLYICMPGFRNSCAVRPVLRNTQSSNDVTVVAENKTTPHSALRWTMLDACSLRSNLNQTRLIILYFRLRKTFKENLSACNARLALIEYTPLILSLYDVILWPVQEVHCTFIV